MQAVAAAACSQVNTKKIPAQQQQELDHACLLLCIALLDQSLRGNIYDSVIVGFLAVLGIQEPKESTLPPQGFREATTYTPFLSAFVKMAQLLVIQRAVVAAEHGDVEYPADLLDTLQDRLIAYGTRSPMNWVHKLRTLGKAIRDTTTALGRIVWSDDGEQLKYRGLEFSMTGLQHFLSVQVQAANRQLHELFFVPATEWHTAVPTIDLSQLKDNPANGQPGWSFLKDPRNSSLLEGWEEWLLNRVTGQKPLQKRFFTNCKDGRWNKQAVKEYLAQVDAFLERLLLAAHITGGQPARGTELLSLQPYNTQHGLWRSIFIENGLISLVTSYHKGYSVSGSTRIIHRYLPKDVSRLLVYYLWLVQPFCEQLRILALDEQPKPPSFLWACTKGAATVPWPSAHLTRILAKEFREHLDTDAAILLWRHAAIAVSRRHLRQAKFHKDYGVEASQSWNELQSAHLSGVAGAIYARGIHEAPGHVEAARTEYRRISREWHTFLGLGDTTSSSKAEAEAGAEAGVCQCGAAKLAAAEAEPTVQQPVKSAPLQQTAPKQTPQQQTPQQQTPRQKRALPWQQTPQQQTPRQKRALPWQQTPQQQTPQQQTPQQQTPRQKRAVPWQQTPQQQTPQQQTPWRKRAVPWQQTPQQQTALLQRAPKAVPNNLRLYMSPDQQAMFMARIKQEETGDKELPPARGQLKRKALSEVPLNRVAKWPRGDDENGECRTRDR
jgi:hypothetical protein